MNVLVACEYSGRVREAFRAQGHNAWSVDLLPSEDNSPFHITGDMWDFLRKRPKWDLIIAHPECTFHTLAGVRWFTTIPAKPAPGIFYGEARWEQWRKAVAFFKRIQALDVPKLVIENPLMHGYSLNEVGKYSQIIQPWQFGHKEMKATALWVRGLPLLKPSRVVGPPPKDPIERRKWAKVHLASPGPLRWKERSRTYTGIARAFAAQWGDAEVLAQAA